MSIDDELLKEEVQRRIDSVLQDIEDDYNAIPGPNVKSRWDFIYGYANLPRSNLTISRHCVKADT
ncbi:MAG: hypothetical protein M3297_03900 [Thermoproteota archaeon]|nr:hypothetical protein [Thermoproteota archaeon]